MLQSFIIFLREGFESFLIVAIILTYLRKTGRSWLKPAVYSAIAASLVASAALGYVLMRGVNQSLWEGILGLVAVVLVATLVIHMWRTAPQLKPNLERALQEVSSRRSRWRAILGVFLFTLFMITREGMETALMLLQVRDGRFLGGLFLGLGAAAALAWAWTRFGYLINLKRFFQVTGVFLLLFMAQIAIYSFHELSEAGVLPASDAIHEATEPFSPYGVYGKWFSVLIVLVCAVWLTGSWLVDRSRRRPGGAGVKSNRPAIHGQGGEVSSGQGGEVSSGQGGDVSSGQGGDVSSGQGSDVSSGQGSEVSSGQASDMSSRRGELLLKNLLLLLVMLASSPLVPAATARELSPEALAARVDSLAAEMSRLRGASQSADRSELTEIQRRLDVLAGEIERIQLADAEPGEAEIDAEVPAGLGHAAAKIYRTGRGVAIGGYGEMLYQNFDEEREDGAKSGRSDELDFLRGVVYVGAKWGERWLFNSEIEFEHASTGGAGEVSVEFAYVEALWRPEVNLRAGLVLLPVGFVNELHEPTIFLGARRPGVEQVILPTTWRENGIGIYGEPGPFNYRTYVVNGLDAAGFSARGLRDGRQSGSRTKAEDIAWVGRLDFIGVRGLLAGASAYAGNSGQGLALPDGREVGAGTTLVEGHLEWKWQGVEIRGLAARAVIEDVAELNAAHPDSLTGNLSVGERLQGHYLQLGYDFLTRWPRGEQSLTPYLRWDRTNTQDQVPAGFEANPANDIESWTFGLAYGPIDPILFKADYQNFHAAGTGVDQLNVALGYIF